MGTGDYIIHTNFFLFDTKAFIVKKIIIAGSAGVGKSTLGKKLSKKLSIPHIELDHLFWLPDWKPRPEQERKKIAKEKTLKESG